ncbi:MGDG synthase family glycosyltransferase [Cellvibrio fibrivorans]|uniref:UDP-N-acetylglucosamine:LPS N-acetylglucosamine transferase n=1 Tax=Cellvibrio fibrivorans TaxID=126350 RepID=A0ABU1UWB7_9GAMM|nr:glycosyltransferase [Cellvibrio fibrivorans]MDR7089461.1 UDP-N-acetylglucosamine:LPS N-acetylglucosamine transferase [Cellvibrio fibrivorans]
MKCLFLTSSPGYGHTRAAEAIDMALQCRYPGIETEYLNITSLLDSHVSNAIQDGYLRMTAEQPELYQKLYDMDKNFYRQLAGKIPADQNLIDFLEEQQRRFFPEVFERSRFSLPVFYKSLDSALLNTLINSICNREKIPAGRLLTQGLLVLIFNILAARVRKFVNEYKPDILIATQMYPNALLSHSIKKGLIKQPVIGVLTDYGVHGVWVRNTTDTYCVSHEDVAAELRKQGIAADRIKVTGIPLVPAFSNIPTQSQARAHLGLDSCPTVLITGGQCSIGVLNAVQKLLNDEYHNYQILVTAGKHTADMETLQQLARHHQHRFRLYGWCSDISYLICAADVVVGKPGGLTLSETLACGRPFIATCCLGGQEAHNVQFLQTNKVGLQAGLEQLPQVLDELFSNTELLRNMKRNAYQLGRPDAAMAVVAELENILQQDDDRYIEPTSAFGL